MKQVAIVCFCSFQRVVKVIKAIIQCYRALRFLCWTRNAASRNPYASFSHRHLTAGMWITIKTRNFKLRRAWLLGDVAYFLTGDKHGIFIWIIWAKHVCAFVDQVIRRQFSFAAVAFTVTINRAMYISARPLYANAQPALLLLRNLFQAPLQHGFNLVVNWSGAPMLDFLPQLWKAIFLIG